MDLSAASIGAAATPPVADDAFKALQQHYQTLHSSTGAAAVSANTATAPSGVSAADPSPETVLHLTYAASAPSTLYAEGPSIGDALASADTAAPPQSVSAANSPTGATFVSAGPAAPPSVADAVDLSTDSALAPTSATAAPRCQHCSECCPSWPSYQHCGLFKKPQCQWLYSGDIGSHDA